MRQRVGGEANEMIRGKLTDSSLRKNKSASENERISLPTFLPQPFIFYSSQDSSNPQWRLLNGILETSKKNVEKKIYLHELSPFMGAWIQSTVYIIKGNIFIIT